VVIRIVINDLWRIVIPTMYNSMAYNGDIFLLVNLAEVFIVDQLIQHILECFFLSGNLGVNFLVFRYGFSIADIFELGRRRCQAVDLSFCELFGLLLMRSTIDGDLDGRGAGIDGEYDFRHDGSS
jgi:hypothetical protein